MSVASSSRQGSSLRGAHVEGGGAVRELAADLLGALRGRIETAFGVADALRCASSICSLRLR